MTASSAALIIFLEVLVCKLGCYLLNVQGDVPILDLVAYSSYKFVGVIGVLITKLVTGGGAGLLYAVFGYLGICFGFYTLRTLKYLVLPESTATVVTPIRKRRIHFLFVVAGMQMFTSWLLI